MTLSGLISTKTSQSPGKCGKVRGGLRSWNKVSQNTFKNTPEDDLDTLCDVISHLTSKYRPDLLGLRKLLNRTGLVQTLTITKYLMLWINLYFLYVIIKSNCNCFFSGFGNWINYITNYSDFWVMPMVHTRFDLPIRPLTWSNRTIEANFSRKKI